MRTVRRWNQGLASSRLLFKITQESGEEIFHFSTGMSRRRLFSEAISTVFLRKESQGFNGSSVPDLSYEHEGSLQSTC